MLLYPKFPPVEKGRTALVYSDFKGLLWGAVVSYFRV